PAARAVAFSPDGTRIVTAGYGATVWHARTGAAGASLESDAQVRDVAFSPDGRRLATAGEDGTVRIWNARSGAQLLVLTGHDWRVWAVAFSPDGARLASVGHDGRIRVWDAQTGRQLAGTDHGLRVARFPQPGKNNQS